MLETQRVKDEWGQFVIYVSRCSQYVYEKQTDTYDLHNIENPRIYDIILKEENYNNL